MPFFPPTLMLTLAVTGVLSLLLGTVLIVRRIWRLRNRNIIRKRPALDFSTTGIIYCSLLLFMGLAAINSQANLLFGVFGLMIGILLISGVISRRVMHGLTVRRVLPDHGTVGRAMTIKYQITNHKAFWPSMSMTLSELDGAEGFSQQPCAYLLHAPPGATTPASAEIVPTRRGLHRLNRFQIGSSFPFGFINRTVTQNRAEVLLVYPPLAQVDQAVLKRCKAVDKTGASIHPTKGGSDEFYGVREYRPGDNPRRIHWRRSARTAAMGVLVAREMTQVAPPRILIMVDTFLPPGTRPQKAVPPGTAGGIGNRKSPPADTPESLVEKTIAIAASMASAALDAELSVGLICWSNTWNVMEPGYGKRHRNDLLSVLAQLPVNRSFSAGELLLQSRRLLRTGTTGVLCTAGNAMAGAIAPQRNATLVLTPGSAETAGYFRFDSHVDFTRCAPQEVTPGAAVRARQEERAASNTGRSTDPR